MTYDQLVLQFSARYAKGAYHAAAFYRSFYRDPHVDVGSLPAFQDSPRLAERVCNDLDTALPRVEETLEDGSVVKSVLELSDGSRIEMVVIPMASHTTVCISSQVGCAMACRFCRTGQTGLRRDLSVAEIVSQVYLAKLQMGLNVRNVVFMGMGEPLDNFDAVTQSIAVISDQRGLDIAKRHITLSTCGHADGIRRLAGLNWSGLKLAVSLNAPNDLLRSELMPINRRYPLADLKMALQGWTKPLLIEYVLIKGVNDGEVHAAQLADFLTGLPAKLNLIPYNPFQEDSFEAPSPGDIACFQQELIARKIFVRLRSSKGAGIQAACGQLGASGNPSKDLTTAGFCGNSRSMRSSQLGRHGGSFTGERVDGDSPNRQGS